MLQEKRAKPGLRTELQKGALRMVCGTGYWKRPGGSVDRLIRSLILNDKDICESAAVYFEDSLVEVSNLLDRVETKKH